MWFCEQTRTLGLPPSVWTAWVEREVLCPAAGCAVVQGCTPTKFNAEQSGWKVYYKENGSCKTAPPSCLWKLHAGCMCGQFVQASSHFSKAIRACSAWSALPLCHQTGLIRLRLSPATDASLVKKYGLLAKTRFWSDVKCMFSFLFSPNLNMNFNLHWYKMAHQMKCFLSLLDLSHISIS